MEKNRIELNRVFFGHNMKFRDALIYGLELVYTHNRESIRSDMFQDEIKNQFGYMSKKQIGNLWLRIRYHFLEGKICEYKVIAKKPYGKLSIMKIKDREGVKYLLDIYRAAKPDAVPRVTTVSLKVKSPDLKIKQSVNGDYKDAVIKQLYALGLSQKQKIEELQKELAELLDFESSRKATVNKAIAAATSAKDAIRKLNTLPEGVDLKLLGIDPGGTHVQN
jgi:hypothetical protein